MTDSSPDRQALLARRFVDLADTLVDDYDVADLLQQLVHTVIELVPVDQAGLLLLDDHGNAQLLAATSESTRLLELFQLQSLERGPCLESIESGEPVSVPDLRFQRDRWPAFASVALGLGVEHVHALPMRLRRDVIGALNLFGTGPVPDRTDLELAQALADFATIALLQERSSQRAALEAQQLREALDSRVVIEQAKGVLAQAGSLDMEAAFAAIRTYARRRNLKISHVARRLVDRTVPADAVLAGRRPEDRPED